MKLLLVLLAWGACQFILPEVSAASIGKLARQWRDFWLGRDAGGGLLGLGLVVGLPLLLIFGVLHAFHGLWHSVVGLPLSLAVVAWVLLDRHSPEVQARFRDSWLARSWPDANAEPDLIPPEASLALELDMARRELLRERLGDLFSPLFWYLLLPSPLGIAAYYLIRITAEVDANPAGQLAQQWQRWADWLPARVLGLTLALAGDFTATWKYLGQRLADLAVPGSDLLEQAALAAHPVTVVVNTETAAGPALVLALADVDALLKRALVIWLVLLALHTLWL